MLTRRETLRGGSAAVAAIAVTGAVAAAVPAIAKSATSRDLPALADEPLFEAIRAFHAAYEATGPASEAWQNQYAETMARAESEGIWPGRGGEWCAFLDENLDAELFNNSDAAWRRAGECANVAFDIPAQTLRGAIEKLRIIRLSVDANGNGSDDGDNLIAYQDHNDPWFDKVLADLERLAGGASS